jgi:beta-glucosidase-like glycosyl hydrolase
LAPVAEVGDGSPSAFLGERAYGGNPELVAAAAAGFVEGMRRAGVACAVKHFPGNSSADPHKATAVLDVSESELDGYLRPFALVLARARPAAVMVSHVVVPAIDPDRPATLSAAVVEGLLRGQLGFRGIAVSDDLRMGAIAAAGYTPERAAPLALAAGIDLVMTWPADAERLRDAIVAAVEAGSLSRTACGRAATRIVAVKARYGYLDPEIPRKATSERPSRCSAGRRRSTWSRRASGDSQPPPSGLGQPALQRGEDREGRIGGDAHGFPGSGQGDFPLFRFHRDDASVQRPSGVRRQERSVAQRPLPLAGDAHGGRGTQELLRLPCVIEPVRVGPVAFSVPRQKVRSVPPS